MVYMPGRMAVVCSKATAARKRRKCEIEVEISGKREKKNHSVNFERMLWGKEAM